MEMLRVVLYGNYKDETSAYQTCLKHYPDFALHNQDEYMAALINSLCERTDIETLFVVCGIGQSRSIPHYMTHSPRRLVDVTKDEKVFESLLRRDTVEQQIDKLCLTDLMLGPTYTATDFGNIQTSTVRTIEKIAKTFNPKRGDVKLQI